MSRRAIRVDLRLSVALPFLYCTDTATHRGLATYQLYPILLTKMMNRHKIRRSIEAMIQMLWMLGLRGEGVTEFTYGDADIIIDRHYNE